MVKPKHAVSVWLLQLFIF